MYSYSQSNVISLNKLRWNRRVNRIKQQFIQAKQLITHPHVMIAAGFSVVGLLVFGLVYSSVLKHPELYSYLLTMPS